MSFAIWRTAKVAKAMGATHYGRFMGIVPGFLSEDGLWVPRSDLLCWLEDFLSLIWVTMRKMRGEEPDFMFAIGRAIE